MSGLKYSCFLVQHKTPLFPKKERKAISVNSSFFAPVVKSRIISNKVAQTDPAHNRPSIWVDELLTYSSDVEEANAKMEQQKLDLLKERIRNMLTEVDKPSEKLNLIDDIQRLGVAYHFETEIEVELQHIYETYEQHDDHKYANEDDLYTVALLFRLLRKEGYHISCDVFNKFVDKNEKFQESLSIDVRGMLSLYEATHLRIHGEDILDKALEFTTHNLKSALPNLSRSPIAAQVVHALHQPIHKGLTRLESRRYISSYEQDDSHNKVVLDFARRDFNLLQKLHQREIREMKMWWKDLDFARTAPFAKERVVETYLWAMGVLFEPQFSFARKLICQSMALIITFDDICDTSNAPVEEFMLFNDAIQRWEISASDQLPEYMKPCFLAVLKFCAMIDEEVTNSGRSYCVDYAITVMKDVLRALVKQGIWSRQGYFPSLEEYYEVSLVSCGYKVFSVLAVVGMGEMATKEAMEWVANDPLIVKASILLARITDDIADYKSDEDRVQLGEERENLPTVVKCYMQHYGLTEEQAIEELEERVTSAWKDVNSECLRPTAVSMPLLMPILNLARVIDVFYKGEDTWDYAATTLKEYMTSVLIDSVHVVR